MTGLLGADESGGALQFHAETHQYRWRGDLKPSVTQVLEESGLTDYSMVPRALLKEAQERGTRVHLATQFFDEGNLDEASVAASDRPYLDAYKKFRAETRFEITAIEVSVYHPHGYAGRIDRVGRFLNSTIATGCVLDIKTGTPNPANWLQLAGYMKALWFLYGNTRQWVCDRVLVYLEETGKYKVERKTGLGGDWDVFVAALRVAQWKRQQRSKQ